jgi:hypothetical protein
MINLHRDDVTYAKDQLRHWLYGLEVNRTPSIMLPDELGGGHQRFVEQAEEESDDDASPRKKKKKKVSSDDASTPNKDRYAINKRTVNDHPFPSWCLPADADYKKVFTEGALKGWPIVQQPGYPKKSLCCRFQALGHCKYRCGYAHVYHTELSAADKTATTAKFKSIYAQAAA